MKLDRETPTNRNNPDDKETARTLDGGHFADDDPIGRNDILRSIIKNCNY